METPSSPDSGRPPAANATGGTGSAPTPIAELAGRPDFPQCALGMQIDIMGFTGTVIEVMKQSIRVRSSDGTTQRFNTYRLKQIHGPRVEEPKMTEAPETSPERAPQTMTYSPAPAANETTGTGTNVSPQKEAPAPAEPEFIENPDFTQPLKPISFYAGRSDFPECALGMHVDVAGYSGVVVAIARQSVKIRNTEGDLRSYNSLVLRKLYGRR